MQQVDHKLKIQSMRRDMVKEQLEKISSAPVEEALQ